MLNIAICDDEIEQVNKVKMAVDEFMMRYSIVYNVETFSSGEELLGVKSIFDLVFLDIVMEGMNGIEVGIILRNYNFKVKVIYITSSNEYWNYAINNVHAFAYLTKPICKKELFVQIKEVIKVIGIEKREEVEIEFTNAIEIGNKEREYPLIKIQLSDIIFFEYVKQRRKIRINLVNKTYEYSGKMSDLEQKMVIYCFGICCRGIIVNLQHVKKVKRNIVYFKEYCKAS